ncbi:Glycine cleavage system transcriptional activator [Roseovarius albus]|uniref:Glycine cleavage system transcriptional activator n=1 Tax=Roseovarius albus TaxID=1247867 RepID=A0A1X6YH20_9RHOB|nr:LysR substrate-binding domain-containing protein [Roseovarius albus]SLN20950.1 Glycine cleavage system transcriptional activator [Roseovarius albus]
MTRIPSTQALRALESFARHGAVRPVAEEMHLTRSAVSHQLRLLERDLGFALFNRVGTRLILTSRGEAFAQDVRGALTQISGSASRNAAHGLSGQLTISCTPGFAASWLSPKIESFRTICPDVALSIITPRTLDEASNPEADVFITFSNETLTGVNVELLKKVEFTPLLSPALANRMGNVQTPADVLRSELLHLSEREDWERWLKLADVHSKPIKPGIIFADMNLIYNAAIKAQGIALGDEFICGEAISNGQLIRPFDLAIQSLKSYYLAIPPAKAEIANIVAFRQWLLDQLPDPGT